VYRAAKKQVFALRSGYKHYYRRKPAKSFIPEFRLRETSIEKRLTMETVVGIDERSGQQHTSSLPLKNLQPSSELMTLRIHHGQYQNPNIELLNRNDDKSMNKILRKDVRTKKFWKKISKDQKAARFVGIVMGVFVVCWLPYFVYLTLSGVFIVRLKDELNHELLFKIFSWLGYTNSALDVLVYIFTSKELRMTFLKLFSRS
jgi:hypothetical protein